MSESFSDYVKHLEPSMRELGYIWLTTMGLQAVDGLKTSPYLEEVAKLNIEGKITFEEAEQLIMEHYKDCQYIHIAKSMELKR